MLGLRFVRYFSRSNALSAPKKVEKLTVIGSGFMGSGIAQVQFVCQLYIATFRGKYSKKLFYIKIISELTNNNIRIIIYIYIYIIV